MERVWRLVGFAHFKLLFECTLHVEFFKVKHEEEEAAINCKLGGGLKLLYRSGQGDKRSVCA